MGSAEDMDQDHTALNVQTDLESVNIQFTFIQVYEKKYLGLIAFTFSTG